MTNTDKYCIRLSPATRQIIDELLAAGMYGTTRTGVVTRLIENALAAHRGMAGRYRRGKPTDGGTTT